MWYPKTIKEATRVVRLNPACTLGAALAVFTVGAIPPQAVVAQVSMISTANEAQVVRVPLNKSRVVSLKTNVKRVSIAQPEVADIVVTGGRQITVVGKTLGTTNVVLWNSRDEQVFTIDVEVSHDIETLKARLNDLFPLESPKVYSTQGNLILSGEVSTVTKADAIMRVALSFLPKTKEEREKKHQVVNLMQVGGNHQVMLEVKVAEVSRSVMKRFGVSLQSLHPGSNFSNFGLFNGGARFPDARIVAPDLLRNPGDPRVPIFGKPVDGRNAQAGPVVDEIAPNEPVISSTGLLLSFLEPGFLFNLVVDAAKENGLAKILAEPTLTAMSGQQAEFLSGGEFPVPVPDDDGIAIEFKPFGIGVKFLPVVLSSGRISLKLDIEVSEISNDNSFVVDLILTDAALAVPGLSKRQVVSTVELGAGQTIGIAGLISDDTREVVSKFPGLGDVPVLGQLFRSQDFLNEKTELVVFVTPKLATPLATSDVRLPTDSFVEPSDYEFYILGRMQGKAREERVYQHSRTAQVLHSQFGHDLGTNKQ